MQILIIDDVHPILTESLRTDGHEVDYHPAITRLELLTVVGKYEGLVVRSKTPIDRDVLLHAEKLKFIGRAGAGLDNIDLDFCFQHEITCFNAGEANADAVGEQAVGMLLTLYSRIHQSDKQVRSGIWDREGNRGRELNGDTVGIIGYGNTGKAVARKLSGFGVTVLAYDKYLENYGDQYAQEADMNAIFERSDVISFHVPLTEETTHLCDSTYLSKFHKPLVVLNLSRGKVVNLDHLVTAMRKKKVLMAGLDVLENEQINQLKEDEKQWMNYLVNSEETLLTPHIGGWTFASYRKISEVLLQKIRGLSSS